jgi:hypothetical protein
MNFARQAGAAVVLVALKFSLGVGGAAEIDQSRFTQIKSSRIAKESFDL